MTTLMGKRQTPVTRYCCLKHQSSFNAKVPSTPKFVQQRRVYNTKVCSTPKFVQHRRVFKTKVRSTPKYKHLPTCVHTHIVIIVEIYQLMETWQHDTSFQNACYLLNFQKKTFYVPLFVHALIIYKYYVFAYLPKTNIKWSIKWATLFNVLLLSGMNVSSVLI